MPGLHNVHNALATVAVGLDLGIKFDTIADLQLLEGILATRGYSAKNIAAILHGNWLRLLRDAWRS